MLRGGREACPVTNPSSHGDPMPEVHTAMRAEFQLAIGGLEFEPGANPGLSAAATWSSPVRRLQSAKDQAPPVPGPLLLCTGHPNHCQRVFVASQVTVQAQAERAAIASISLHAGVAFVELLRSDDVAVCASLEQRAVESEAESAGFIDDVNLKAFPPPRFDPGDKFRGSKSSRWPRRSVVVLEPPPRISPGGCQARA